METFNSASSIVFQYQDTTDTCALLFIPRADFYYEIFTRASADNTITLPNAFVVSGVRRVYIEEFICIQFNVKADKIWSLSSSASSRWTELEVRGKRPQMTEKFFCLSLYSLCCTLPHFFFFHPSLTQSSATDSHGEREWTPPSSSSTPTLCVSLLH